MRPFIVRLTLLALAVTGFAGCGASTGTVSGTVTVNKEPLANGTITFVGDSGEPRTAGIVNGKYETVAMPTGNYKVMISVRDQGPPTPEAPPEAINPTGSPTPIIGSGLGPADGKARPAVTNKPQPKKTAIDPKFNDPDKSGLSTTVKAGPNTFNADL